MSPTREEIHEVAFDMLSYIVRKYPLKHRVRLKTTLGNDGSFAPEVTVLFQEYPMTATKFIEVECNIWLGNGGHAATINVTSVNTKSGDSMIRYVGVLENLDEILPYLEEAIQLFGLEKTE